MAKEGTRTFQWIIASLLSIRYVLRGGSYHIWVVPMAGPGVGDDGVLVISVVVDDARHGLPAVLDVVEVAPNVTGADDRLVVWLQQDI